MLDWQTTQHIEERWWGNCVNTYVEEMKQQVYARKIGLQRFHSNGQYTFPMGGKSVVDIGGGACSLLLKCFDVRGTVVDPFRCPAWVMGRYQAAGITVKSIRAEDFTETGWDEVWVYNLLEHVDCPATVVKNARRAGRILRVFEWLGTRATGPHRHVLSKQLLDDLYEADGTVEQLDEDECRWLSYYGVFKQ